VKPTLVWDLEVYGNYTLAVFKNVETKAVWRFELPLDELDLEVMRHLVTTHRLVGFNSIGYDWPLTMLILRGENSATIKKASDRIIVHGLTWWHFEKEWNVTLDKLGVDHIDLMNVAPLVGGLKVYSGRLHTHSIQDLPIDPSATITEEQKLILRRYCENDCNNTTDLLNALKEQIELRESMSATYGIDLRSKSDQQVAEAVIKTECERRLGTRLEKPGSASGDKFRYHPPAWLKFTGLNILEQVIGAWFIVSDAGKVLMPPELAKRNIQIGAATYRMGIGGLHSQEKSRVVEADDQYMIMDFDVASYYPAILLNEGLYPKHIGPVFLEVYRALRDQRLAAKKAGRTIEAASLKVTILGTFGKLANEYSVLYSPDLFIQITVTGQLALLMFIESLADVPGAEVISANTDGVTVRCYREYEGEVMATVKAWERATGFETERTDYSGVYSRDVSNYVAIKTDGGTKLKGVYGEGLPLSKNKMHTICLTAVRDYLQFGASIRETVNRFTNVREFVCMRSVKGGATYCGQEIGRVARWIYVTNSTEALHYKVNNYLVPDTAGACPVVELPAGVPDDLDREWYIRKAQSMLNDLGVMS